MRNKFIIGRHVSQGLVEYALILVLVTVVVILTLQLTGINVRGTYCKVVSGLGGGGGCAHYCEDNFANLSGWSLLNNQGWQVSNGQMCNVPGSEQRAYNACSQNSLPNNYSVTLTNAILLQGNGYGILFRMQSTSPTNGYAFQYDPGASGFVIRKWVNGWEINPALAFASASGFNWYNSPRKVQVVVSGNTFKAYVDGQLVLTAVDTTYSSGSAGLRSWDGTRVCADGFSVDPMP